MLSVQSGVPGISLNAGEMLVLLGIHTSTKFRSHETTHNPHQDQLNTNFKATRFDSLRPRLRRLVFFFFSCSQGAHVALAAAAGGGGGGGTRCAGAFAAAASGYSIRMMDVFLGDTAIRRTNQD